MDAELSLRAVCRALFLPPLGPLLLAAFGLWLLARRPWLGRWLVAVALALLLLLSMPVIADRLSALVERYPPLAPAALPAAEVIVVLSGGIRRPPSPAAPTPSPATLERLAGAAALARRTGLPLLLSGGVVGSGPAEADVMQAALREDFGMQARFVERRSRTTAENALESARLLRAAGLRRVALVTSAVHMRRAMGEFSSTGLEIVPVPVGAASDSGRDLADWLPRAAALEVSYAALYEVAGGIVARLRGRR